MGCKEQQQKLGTTYERPSGDQVEMGCKDEQQTAEPIGWTEMKTC
jgi:hypothetical protein